MSTGTISQKADLDLPPSSASHWSGERIAGVVLLVLWAALGIALAVYILLAWNPDLYSRYTSKYLSGLRVTLSLVGSSIVLGAILSAPIAYARMSRNPILSGLAYAYVYFFRGTPLIAQTFLVYYGLGQFRPQLEAIGLWSFFRDAWYCAIFTFSLNTAAYQAEILRGAIQSVPKGQWEGAASLGFPNCKHFGRLSCRRP